MGIYRFLLASLVVASHCGLLILGYNEGVVAVVSFMLLSGYVMTKLIGKYYQAPAGAAPFYLDRLGRLLPQFLFYSAAAAGLLQFTRLGALSLPWMDYRLCPVPLVLLNFSLIGNNFSRILEGCMLLPASWSLGLEATFYALAPFLLQRAHRLARLGAVALSLAVFLLADFGVLDADLYAYRFLPGTLFIFAAGAALADSSLFPSKSVAALWALALIVLAWIWRDPALYGQPFVKEVLAGFLTGVPILAGLAKLKFREFDELAGNLSYGVYLNHILLIWIAKAYLGVQSWNMATFAVLLAAASGFATASYYLVEVPALRWRRRIRLAQGAGIPA